MTKDDIPQFIDVLLAVGAPVCAVGRERYVIGDADMPEKPLPIWPAAGSGSGPVLNPGFDRFERHLILAREATSNDGIALKDLIAGAVFLPKPRPSGGLLKTKTNA